MAVFIVCWAVNFQRNKLLWHYPAQTILWNSIGSNKLHLGANKLHTGLIWVTYSRNLGFGLGTFLYPCPLLVQPDFLDCKKRFHARRKEPERRLCQAGVAGVEELLMATGTVLQHWSKAPEQMELASFPCTRLITRHRQMQHCGLYCMSFNGWIGLVQPGWISGHGEVEHFTVPKINCCWLGTSLGKRHSNLIRIFSTDIWDGENYHHLTSEMEKTIIIWHLNHWPVSSLPPSI